MIEGRCNNCKNFSAEGEGLTGRCSLMEQHLMIQENLVSEVIESPIVKVSTMFGCIDHEFSLFG